MNAQKRRKKRIRNILCAAYCALQLVVVLLGVRLATFAVNAVFVPKETNEVMAVAPKKSEPEEEKKEGNANEEKKLVVCIDAGHGGKDDGAVYDKRLEKDDCLKLALEVSDYLKGKGIEVVMTREGDTYPELSERIELANSKKVDYFVSLHRNKGDGKGVEVWINSKPSEETTALGHNIMEGLDAVGIQRNRGVKQGTQKSQDKDYYLNANTTMPSCIVELGFLNDAEDSRFFDDNLSAYAQAIGDAIQKTYDSYEGAKGSGDGTQPGTDGGANEGAGGDSDEGTGDGSNSGDTPLGEEGTNGTKLVNQVIENVESLDGTCLNWGQGSNVDDKNRPVDAVAYQEKYGPFNGEFVGEGDNVIYLTLDEGYEYGFTPSILDTLKEKGVNAVFFVTESYAKKDPDYVKRIIDEGHALGNHSVTHPADGLPSQTLEQQKNEVMENHQYILDNFGYEMHLFRFPAGKFSEQSLAVVNNCNYKSMFWSFAYLDYDVNNQPNQEESLNKLIAKLHPGAIYLLHAESETNAAILGEFIDQARAKGYEFKVYE